MERGWTGGIACHLRVVLILYGLGHRGHKWGKNGEGGAGVLKAKQRNIIVTNPKDYRIGMRWGVPVNPAEQGKKPASEQKI